MQAVDDSAWLDELRRIEAAHPRGSATPFREAHHIVLTLLDPMLEAVAQGVRVVGSETTLEQAVTTMAQMILPVG